MQKNIFTSEESQAVVDTLIEGNNAYLQERVNKLNTMEVSGGYAWTRPNHLDHSFATAELPFISKFTLKKAGESWQYLEFQKDTNNDKILLIIKNQSRLAATYEKKEGAKQSQYLLDYAEINRTIANPNGEKNSSDIIELELFYDDPIFDQVELKEQLQGFKAFYVIVYELNNSRHIEKVEVVMLNPYSQLLESVQDLSNYLRLSEIPQFDAEILQDFPIEKPLITEGYGYLTREDEEADGEAQ